MATSSPRTITRTLHPGLTQDGLGPVEVTLTETGVGHPVLLLHGGGGPATVAGFASLLASSCDARVLAPVHPGFAGTPRPEALTRIAELASTYVALLDDLDLTGVTVVGNSIGGWIAAEIGLLGSPRVSGVVLVDAVGLDVPEHPVADFFSLGFPELAQLSYYTPDAFRIDPTTMSPQARQDMAGNRAALAVYAGDPSMVDPTLLGRLLALSVPTLVVWGDSDRIVTPEHGQAYAAAVPGARLVVLPRTGHLPQLESPQALRDVVWSFVGEHVAPRPAR